MRKRGASSDPFLIKLDRSSTNFQLRLFEHLKQLKHDSAYSFLKYYQDVTRQYVESLDIDSRGLLIYWTMGVGKSLGAVAIAIDEIKSGRQPIILLTKSLQGNMIGAIKKYINMRKAVEPDYYLARLSEADVDQWIKRNFSFVSMNASNMLKQMGKAAEGRTAEEFDAALEKKIGEIIKFVSLDGKLLIVDEAHNLFRAITNGSKNALGLYDMIMKSKNLKCIFLTGTPIANDPFELVPCFNMLGSRRSETITLPENYKDFVKYFVDERNGRIKNKDKFQNRIMGLISHITHKSTPGASIGVGLNDAAQVEFPLELPMKVERVPMDPVQYVIYQLARDKEREEGQTGFGPGKQITDMPSMMKPKSKASSSYRVKSRQLSNFCPPEGFREEKDQTRIPKSDLSSPKIEALYQNILAHDNQLGLIYSQFIGIGGLGILSEFLKNKGWEEVRVDDKVKATRTEAIFDDLEESEPGEQGEKDEYIGMGELKEVGDVIPPQFNPDEFISSIEQELNDSNINTDDIVEILLRVDDEMKSEHDDTNILKYIDSIKNDIAIDMKHESALRVRYGNVDDLESLQKFAGNDYKLDRSIFDFPFYVLIVETKDTEMIGFALIRIDKIIREVDQNECTAEIVYTKTLRGFGAIMRKFVADVALCGENNDEFKKNIWKTGGCVVGTLGAVETLIKSKIPAQKKRFAIISGEVSPEGRTAIQNLFNSPQNAHGGIIDVLLVSATGAEGLDLKNIRHIHIMEPYWNFGRIAQIKARGIRNDSHKDLDESEKNVQPYIYIAVPPPGESDPEGKTTDEDLYEESLTNQTIIESFIEALREVSIECLLNADKNCRVCAPTGEPLFTSDIGRDLKAADPCSQVKEAQIKAEFVVVDGIKYFYVHDAKSVFDYKIFEFDKDLNGYKQLAQSDPRFMRIIDEINKKISEAK